MRTSRGSTQTRDRQERSSRWPLERGVHEGSCLGVRARAAELKPEVRVAFSQCDRKSGNIVNFHWLLRSRPSLIDANSCSLPPQRVGVFLNPKSSRIRMLLNGSSPSRSGAARPRTRASRRSVSISPLQVLCASNGFSADKNNDNAFQRLWKFSSSFEAVFFRVFICSFLLTRRF